MTTSITTNKVTRPMINKILKDEGFIKAEWRNRETEKLWNDGYLVTEVKSWLSLTTSETCYFIEYAYQNWNNFDADEIHENIMGMALALKIKGLDIFININRDGKADAIKVVK